MVTDCYFSTILIIIMCNQKMTMLCVEQFESTFSMQSVNMPRMLYPIWQSDMKT